MISTKSIVDLFGYHFMYIYEYQGDAVYVIVHLDNLK